ncbi:MAG: hypothetical protein ACLUHJ_08635, partial [Ruminococcus sp.]|uniref:hypothetical protein n=1 Tax=Ruminococcus sp. TaxID=41978 RepID=UPI00307B61B2
ALPAQHKARPSGALSGEPYLSNFIILISIFLKIDFAAVLRKASRLASPAVSWYNTSNNKQQRRTLYGKTENHLPLYGMRL